MKRYRIQREKETKKKETIYKDSEKERKSYWESLMQSQAISQNINVTLLMSSICIMLDIIEPALSFSQPQPQAY